MPPNRHVWVYLLASRKNGTLYVGVTSDIRTRVWQHRTGAIEGFTKQHRITVLVYLEEFRSIRAAIDREKALKGWNRARKVVLVEGKNLDWDDLAAKWFD